MFDRKIGERLMETEDRITAEDIAKATAILQRYKRGKVSLENRIVENEKWWKLRRGEKSDTPRSAWLFNSIMGKHADFMDNYPAAVCLPREQSDTEDATMLSEIIPVIFERGEYKETYSDGVWYKLKHGTAAYGVFWDTTLENGLGDIAIRRIDLLNLFWQPGITDIQDSKNLFIVSLVDREALEMQFPTLRAGNVIDIADYVYDDAVDTTDKAVVVDWYYKSRAANGTTVLHFCKFCGDTILYASENDPKTRERGFYAHGMYPVVMDVLYPEEGTPYGFGIIDIGRDPQMYIDRLDAAVLDMIFDASNVRYFAKRGAGINVDDFLDKKKKVVEVEGDISEERLQQIPPPQIPSGILDIKQMKIDELKETTSNRDVSQGGTAGGVTSGAAIATLQEAGNKTSRDAIASSHRAYEKIVCLVIELIREFYSEARSFRITGPNGMGYEFVSYSNHGIVDQPMGKDTEGYENFRRPVFDIQVKAEKQNPFSTMTQNETAVNLYQLGFFNPQMAGQALIALDMMNFEGKEEIIRKISEQAFGMAGMGMAGTAGVYDAAPAPAADASTSVGGTLAGTRERAANLGGYAVELARRATPDMTAPDKGAEPI